MYRKFILLVLSLLLFGCSLGEQPVTDHSSNTALTATIPSEVVTPPAEQTVSKPATTTTTQESLKVYLLTEAALGTIPLNTTFDDALFEQAFADRYHFRTGIAMMQRTLKKYYQVLNGKQSVVTFYLNDKQQVQQIDIFGDSIVTLDKMRVGSQFSDLYNKALNVCHIKPEVANEVECVSPKTPHIRYIFDGNWGGPSELMPSDDVLKSWKVKRIIWSTL